MTGWRLILLLFGLPFVVMVGMGAVFSGGDPKAILFFAKAGAAAIGLIALLSLPLILLANAWQERTLAALAGPAKGTVERVVTGESRLKVVDEQGRITLLFFAETAEVAGSEEPGKPWTCVGAVHRGRSAPAVEVRHVPGGDREVRWSNRWWEELGRDAPADPLTTADARAAAETLAGLFPAYETRIRVDGEVTAFAVPGHVRDRAALLALLFAAGPVVHRLV